MTQASNFSRLDFNAVKSNLDAVVNQAQEALQTFVEDPEQTRPIEDVAQQLSLSHGVLKMLRLQGASLLASELHQVFIGLLERDLEELDEPVQTLMVALNQLPSYLDYLQSGQPDMPVLLLPVLNDLRRSRRAAPLPPGLLVNLKLDYEIPPEALPAAAPAEEPRRPMIAKLRMVFQTSLLAFYRNPLDRKALVNMAKSLNRLLALSPRGEAGRLWLLSLALVEALFERGLLADPGIRLVLGQIERKIVAFGKQGARSLGDANSALLAKSLLYFVGMSTSNGPKVSLVKRTFHLNEQLPSPESLEAARAAMSGPNSAVMSAVGATIKEDLAGVKDVLDVFAHRADADAGELEPIIQTLSRIGDTLGMLRLPNERDALKAQAAEIQGMVRGDKAVNASAFLSIAEALIGVEAALDRQPGDVVSARQLGDTEYRGVIRAVVAAAQEEIARLKDAIIAFNNQPDDTSLISEVPALIDRLKGAMFVEPLSQSAPILDGLRRYIKDSLIGAGLRPTDEVMAALADSIAAIEYFLEGVVEEQADVQATLAYAEQSVQRLGHMSGVASETSAGRGAAQGDDDVLELSDDETDADYGDLTIDEASAAPPTAREPASEPRASSPLDTAGVDSEERPSVGSPSSAQPVDEGLTGPAEDAPDLTLDIEPLEAQSPAGAAAPSEADRWSASGAGAEASSDQDPPFGDQDPPFGDQDSPFGDQDAAFELDLEIDTPESQGPADRGETATPAVDPSGDHAAPVAPAEGGRLPALEVIGDEVDEDILEIFIEEAGEERERIAECMPKWRANPDDRETLSTIRRSFHTLKGSGRLIGAKLVGEFAWSFESMLNRVLDGTVLPSDAVYQVIEDSLPALDEMIEQLKGGPVPTRDVQGLMTRADGLSRPEDIDSGAREGSGSPSAEKKTELTEQEFEQYWSGQAIADDLGLDDIPDHPLEAALGASDPSQLDRASAQAFGYDLDEALDGTLYDIFRSETEGHLAVVETTIVEAERQGIGLEPTPQLQRAWHTIRGSARTAGIDSIARLGASLEHFISDYSAHQAQIGEQGIACLKDAVRLIRNRLENLLEADEDEVAVAELEGRIEALDHAQPADSDAGVAATGELLELYLEEAQTLLESSEQALEAWMQMPQDVSDVRRLQEYLHTLKGSSRMAGFREVGDLIYSGERVLELVGAGEAHADAELFALVQRLIDRLFDVLNRLRQREPITRDEPFERIAASMDAYIRRARGDEDMEAVDEAPVEAPIGPAGSGGPEGRDEELVRLFLDESQDLLSHCEGALRAWLDRPEDSEKLSAMQRDLHTLKGGARMAGLELVGDLCHQLEDLLAGLADDRLVLDPEIAEVLQRGLDSVAGLVENVRRDQPIDRVAADILDDLRQAQVTYAAPVPEEGDGRARPGSAGWGSEVDPEMLELFLEESQELLESLERGYEGWRNDPEDLQQVQGMQRSLHTLKGGSRMAGLNNVGDFVHALEALLESVYEQSNPADDAALFHTREALDRINAVIEQLTAGQLGDSSELDQARRTLEAVLVERAAGADPEAGAPAQATPRVEVHDEILSMFLEEGSELIDAAEELVAELRARPQDGALIQSLQRNLHTIKGGARLAGLNGIGDLSHHVETLLARIANGEVGVDGTVFELLQTAVDRMSVMLEDVRRGESSPGSSGLVALFEDLDRVGNEQVADSPVPSEVAPARLAPGEPMASAASTTTSEPTGVGQAPAEGAAEPAAHADDEIVTMFVEESHDLLESGERCLERWRQEPSDLTQITELKRYLHTLKGGARMAGLDVIGDLSHSLETLLERVGERRIPVDSNLLQLIQTGFDRVAGMSDRVRNGQTVAKDFALLELQQAIDAYTQGRVEAPPTAAAQTANAEGAEWRQQAKAPSPGAELARTRAVSEQPEKPASAQDVIRVRSELLDNLVNNAGEVNIYHSRLGQQVATFGFNLQELERTVVRLRDQLRKMEIETEAQILYRYEREGGRYEDFDPLEMDRYSTLQQLSRALGESVNDLNSLQSLMLEQVRDTETLLIQQKRVSTELQDGLMRTRMVQFAGLTTRLRRILRQTCQVLGKKAELNFIGSESEVDRNLLERIVAPMEHLIRNAIAHGIEAPETRRAQGKGDVGAVTINVAREGGEVVIEVADDGSGIDIDAVRNKAIRQGLISPEARLSDKETMHLLLESGFSTADQVTQISGRGVGMDVVNSEVKQLGGSLRIDSERGQGSTFTMRLPFTLAINQALLVHVGDYNYAIPLGPIEGLVRLSNAELEVLYRSGKPYEYAGNEYQLQYLGVLLGTGYPRFSPPGIMKPVLVIRSGDYRVALQVDDVQGIQEVVVKPVGPQISQVRGISGATILGDGRVVLILEIGGLVRLAAQVDAGIETIPDEPLVTAESERAAAAAAEAERQPIIMVVDDSITIRRVTQRILTRNGMEATLAKDGMDAVAVLQETKPDLVLLDIEMPRMDGFELATHIRNSEDLHEIPIIMISSRSGEKHRQRAFDIGVNRFLSKPYQESDLLDNIKQVLAEQSGVAA